MAEFWIGIAYVLIAALVFRWTYRNGRERVPQHTAGREMAECAVGALLWPLMFVLAMVVAFFLWLGFRGDRT